MNLSFLGGGKKPKEQVIPGKGFVPVDRVREMAARGFSEPEMIDVLRRDGFSADEVDKALTQALRIGVTGEQPQRPPSQQFEQQQQNQNQRQEQNNQPVYQRPREPQNQPQGDFKWPSEQIAHEANQAKLPKKEQSNSNDGLPTLESIGSTQAQNQSQGPQQDASMPQIPETSLPDSYSQQYSSEDYVDYIVQQRMSEVTEKVKEFQNNYEDLQKKIVSLTEEMKNTSAKNSPVQNQVSAKIETFGETVTDVDNRLSGLEKAFKETLPELIDSVRTLSDVVQKVRKEKEQ